VRLTPPQLLLLIVPPVVVTPESSGEKSALVLAAEFLALLLYSPSREKSALVLAAKVPALVEVPSMEKPAVLAAIKPCEPAMLGTRCQRCNRSEKCDELQHGGLFSSAPHLILTPNRAHS
jgi:hypothetical protein